MRILTKQPLRFIGIVFDRVTNEAVATFIQEVDTMKKCEKLNKSEPGRYDWRMLRIHPDNPLWFDEVIP